MDSGQAHIVHDWNTVCKKNLVHDRYKVKIGEIGWNPNFPIHHHCVHKFVFNVCNALGGAFTLDAVDKDEETSRADWGKSKLVKY